MRNEKRDEKTNFKRGFKTLIRKVTLLGLTTAMLTSVTACGKNEEVSADISKKIKVGVCAGPYGDMFEEAIKPSLEAKGYTVELVEFSDYVQPNNALADKEIDVNMFQHSTYLKNFCEQHNVALSYVTEIPTAGMAVFSKKYTSVDEIANGATVAIPNDDTNLSRALRVLVQEKLITFKADVNPAKATIKDIAENPKNLQFTEVNAEVLTSVVDSVGLAVINGNYAISGGLKLSDALYNEQILAGYFNVIAVRGTDIDTQFTKDIVEIVKSDAFKKVIEDSSKQYISFSRPSTY